MNRAQQCVQRLLEDYDDDTPRQAPPPGVAGAPDPLALADGEEPEDTRALFDRVINAPAEFAAKGRAFHRYDTHRERLGNRQRLKLDRHTYLERAEHQGIAVRFYETQIVTYYPDDTVVATTGGFPTKTTRARMNDFLPGGWQIYADKSENYGEDTPEVWWHWQHGGREGGRPIRGGLGKLFWYNTDTKSGTFESDWQIPFTDGDRILADGTLQHQTEEILGAKTARRAQHRRQPR